MSAHTELKETQQEIMLELEIKTNNFMRKLKENRRTIIQFAY